MNGISTLWTNIVNDLIANKVSLGIATAERAQMGKTISLSSAGVAVWLKPGVSQPISHGKPVTIPVEIFFYCASSPSTDAANATDAAIEIAVKVFNRYAGLTLATDYIFADGETSIEVLETKSNAAIVGVMLKCEVTL